MRPSHLAVWNSSLSGGSLRRVSEIRGVPFTWRFFFCVALVKSVFLFRLFKANPSIFHEYCSRTFMKRYETNLNDTPEEDASM